jgi:hypothetical protein
MASIREQIVSTLVAKIKTQLPTVAVWRSRVTAWTRRELPAVNLEALGDAPDLTVIGVITWTMSIRIAVLIADDVPDQAADQLVTQIHQTMIADKSLGGLCMDIEPANVKFDLYNGDGPRGVVSLAYQVLYRTSDADLSQQG